jgi:hypothetical protein
MVGHLFKWPIICLPDTNLSSFEFWMNSYHNSTKQKKNKDCQYSKAYCKTMLVSYWLNWLDGVDGLDGVDLNCWTRPSKAFKLGLCRNDRAIERVIWCLTIPGSKNRAKCSRVIFNLRWACRYWRLNKIHFSSFYGYLTTILSRTSFILYSTNNSKGFHFLH